MYNFFNNQTQQTNTNNSAITDFEILQKARQDLVGELQAIIEYDNHIKSTSSTIAKQTWTNIKNDELTHVGQLLALINYTDETQQQYIQQGIDEFNSRLNS